MKRTASAHWEGTLREGKGTISSQSTVLNNTQYSFKTRFEDGVGTNPEELIAAAHAGCFTMAVVAMLSQDGITPSSADTSAVVNLEGLDVTGIHLSIRASIPNCTPEKFQQVAEAAKATCIISKMLNVPITLDAVLA